MATVNFSRRQIRFQKKSEFIFDQYNPTFIG